MPILSGIGSPIRTYLVLVRSSSLCRMIHSSTRRARQFHPSRKEKVDCCRPGAGTGGEARVNGYLFKVPPSFIFSGICCRSPPVRAGAGKAKCTAVVTDKNIKTFPHGSAPADAILYLVYTSTSMGSGGLRPEYRISVSSSLSSTSVQV